MDARVNVDALRARLARLGVHIDLPATGTTAQGINDASPVGGDGGILAAPPDGRSICLAQGAAARRQQQPRLARSAAIDGAGQEHCGGARGGAGGDGQRSSGHMGGAGPAEPLRPGPLRLPRATGGSKLLVRAAQCLLQDARAQAKALDDAMLCAAAPLQRPRAASGGRGGASAPCVAAGSPLCSLLSQYRDAQATWAQDKAKLRRSAEAARKRAALLELELSKLQRAHAHRAGDVSSLRAALKARDTALTEAQARVRELEAALSRAQSAAAGRLCALAAERDDLQGLLLATLERLEGVEAVVAAADAASAGVEDELRAADAERAAALELAAAARADAASARDAQRRLEHQSALLEKLGDAQARANKRQSAALRELLDGELGGSAAVSSPPVRLSSALQRLLATGDAHAAGPSSCGASSSGSIDGGGG